MAAVSLLCGELPLFEGPQRQVSYQSMATVDPFLTVAALVSHRNPGWITASVIASLPWLYFTSLFIVGGNAPDQPLPALVLFVLAIAFGFVVITDRTSIRTVRQRHPSARQ